MKKIIILFGLLFLILGGMAHASVISSYDIQNAVKSGYGGWSHTYNGTIVDGAAITGGTLATYSGGGGTLNDDVIGSSPANTQLFTTDYQTVITLNLDNAYSISDMTLYSFSGRNNIPGNITSVDLTIGGLTETFATTTTMGVDHEFIDISLGSSGLSNLITNQVVLSGFVSTGSHDNYFSISEIDMTTTGTGAPVPEPATMLLFGLGLLSVAGVSRRKNNDSC